MKIVNWNVNSIKVRLPHLLDLIKQQSPDLILLQETKVINEAFPKEDIENMGYNIYLNGQKTYNGVAILAKTICEITLTNFENNPLPDHARFLEVTTDLPVIGFSRIISLYVPNGGELFSDKFKQKLLFLDNLYIYLRKILENRYDENIIIGSDFNIALSELDVYDPSSLKGVTCFTDIEKEKMRKIYSLGFFDHYRLIKPYGKDFSWWDYRKGAFAKNHGLRIDGIISNAKSTHLLTDFSILKYIRELDQTSDHAPVMSVFSV